MRRALFLVAATLAACGPAVEPPHVLYTADALSADNPFPDLRLVRDGRLQLREGWYSKLLPQKALTRAMRQLLDSYEGAVSETDGVGNFGPTLFPLSERVERASLQGVAVRLIKTADGWAVLEADVPVALSRDALIEEGIEAPADYPEFLVVRPAVVLPQGQEGMLVLKKGIRTEGGELLGRGFGAAQEAEMVARLKTAAGVLGLPESDLLLAMPLRASTVGRSFERVVAWAGNIAPPAIEVGAHALRSEGMLRYPDGVWTPADADWGTLMPWLERRDWSRPATAVGQVVYGTVQMRDLRVNGVWTEATVANPDSAPLVGVRFVLVVPKGQKPAGGWPVVIGAHGINNRNTTVLGDENSFCLELGQLFAAQGMACAGIDAPSHGTRGNPFDFFAVENLGAMRENFREMVVDQMQLIRALPALDVDGDGQGDFRREAGYFGNSLGAIMGSNTTAVDPLLRTSVLNVPGGGLSNILAGEEIRDRIGLLLVARTGLTFHSPEYFASFPFYRTVAQLVLEGADPVNTAQLLDRTKSVLVQEGVGDLTIPNFTTENLAAAMGLEVATAPRLGDAQQLLFRADPKAYLPAERAANYNGHGIMWESEAGEVRAQAARFLFTQGREFSPDGGPVQ